MDIQEFPSGHPLESGHMPLAKFADRVRVTYLAGYNHSAGDLRLAPLSIFRKLGLLPQTAASHPTTHPRRERDFPQRRVPTRHPEEHSKKIRHPVPRRQKLRNLIGWRGPIRFIWLTANSPTDEIRRLAELAHTWPS